MELLNYSANELRVVYMDTNNIPIGDIVISNIDIDLINSAIRQRAESIGSQLPADAAAQLQTDMSAIECQATSTGSGIQFSTKISESYLLSYLQKHGTPVSGGDGGIVHDLDGSTHESRVPKQLQGTPLPWYELPTLDGEDEIKHIIEIMAPDAVQDGINKSRSAIAETIAPIMIDKVIGMLGGE